MVHSVPLFLRAEDRPPDEFRDLRDHAVSERLEALSADTRLRAADQSSFPCAQCHFAWQEAQSVCKFSGELFLGF